MRFYPAIKVYEFCNFFLPKSLPLRFCFQIGGSMETKPEIKLLQDRVVCIPGGRDKDGRPIILITIPQDSPTLEITSCLQHALTIYR